MREILFRGKRIDSGEWVYWNTYGEYTEPFVSKTDMHSHVSECDIDPATVGQYAGLVDKHGRKIFEGDILTDGSTKYLVRYSPHSTGFQAEGFCCGGVWSLYHLCNKHNQGREIWITSNIHDNPSPLEAAPC